tara:strand:- start:600 stop:998 length:399 start_codon:yes stop_codon:yes gene_type:complete
MACPEVGKRHQRFCVQTGNVINPETPEDTVGFLDDDEVLLRMDDTMLATAPHLSSLMSVLFDKGFRPTGEMPTLLFALAHLTNSYETIRMDGGDPKESFDLSAAMTLRHPVMQRMLSNQVASKMDEAAGVGQ